MEKILQQILAKLESLESDMKKVKPKVEDLFELKPKIEDIYELKPKIEESHNWLGALVHRTETMGATLENLANQAAHLSGDVEAIKSSLERDQLYMLGRIAKCEKDIFELKHQAG